MCEGGLKPHTSSEKVSPVDVMQSTVTIVNNTIVAYLKVAKKLDLKSSHHKKKNCIVVNVHQTYRGNHYIMHFTNIKSLICVPETNTMFCVNCTSMKRDLLQKFTHIVLEATKSYSLFSTKWRTRKATEINSVQRPEKPPGDPMSQHPPRTPPEIVFYQHSSHLQPSQVDT